MTNLLPPLQKQKDSVSKVPMKDCPKGQCLTIRYDLIYIPSTFKIQGTSKDKSKITKQMATLTKEVVG